MSSSSRSRRRPRIEDDEELQRDASEAASSSRRTARGARTKEEAATPNGPSTSAASDRAAAVSSESGFAPQPLDKAAADSLRSLLANHGTQQDSLRQALELITQSAEQIAEFDREIDGSETFDALHGDIKELIDLQVQSGARRQALESLRGRLRDDEEITDAKGIYAELTAQLVDLYGRKTSRQKYAQNDAYVAFRERTWEAAKEGAMPPITDLVPAEEGDDENSDDDVQTGGQLQTYKCPLTTMTLEEPMTSTVCKHSYSRAAILQYLSQGNGQHECPASGCKAALTKRTLQADPQLERRVAAFQRRELERELSVRQTLVDQVID